MKINTANKLTILRMILVLVMIIISLIPINTKVLDINLKYIILDIIFIIASITDKLDGWIARSRNQVTTFGKFLDPIADKVLVITAMILLVEIQKLPSWIPIIVIVREFIVSGYRLIAVQKDGKVVAANIWGKVKTATQMVAISLAFIDKNAFADIFTKQLSTPEFAFNLVVTLLMILSTLATIFSGFEYLKGSKKLFQDA